MKRLGFSIAVAAFLFGACGTTGEDICAAKCDCEGCSDSKFDDCVEKSDSEQRDAEHSDCGGEYSAFLDCEDDTGSCVDGEWKTHCGPEHDDLKSCTKPKKKK